MNTNNTNNKDIAIAIIWAVAIVTATVIISPAWQDYIEEIRKKRKEEKKVK